MKVRSLKIATVEGRFVKIGEEFELKDKAAKKYIDAGFIEEVHEKVQEPEPKTPKEPETPKTTTKAKTK